MEFKLNQQRSEVLKTPYWEAVKRTEQVNNYYSDLIKGIVSGIKGIKGGKGVKVPSL